MEKAAPIRANKAAQHALEQLLVPGAERPKLVITGASTMDGRAATLMRVRPSIWRQLEELEATGTRQYLVVELALQMLIAHLQSLPEGETLIVDAQHMSATAQDYILLKNAGREVKYVPRKRVAKTSWTDPESNDRGKSI